MKNTGKPFERSVELVLDVYRKKGQMDVRKVDPPTAHTKRGVIYKGNPFVDYIGCWNEEGGRMIAFEAKSTCDSELELGSGGISSSQQESLTRWAEAGAVVFVLWQFKTSVFFIPWLRYLKTAPARRHIKSTDSEVQLLCQGFGLVLFDFRLSMIKQFSGGMNE